MGKGKIVLGQQWKSNLRPTILSSSRKLFEMRSWVPFINIRLSNRRARMINESQQCMTALLLLHGGADSSFVTVLPSQHVPVHHYLCVKLKTCVFSVCTQCRTCWKCWRRPDAGHPHLDHQRWGTGRHTSARMQPTHYGAACTWPCCWAKHAFVTLWNEDYWRCAQSAFTCADAGPCFVTHHHSACSLNWTPS